MKKKLCSEKSSLMTVQNEESETRRKCNMKRVQHKKNSMKIVQHGKESNMKIVQHRKRVT